MPGKREARYVYSTQHIKAVLDKIQTTGRPEKLTPAYLKKTWLLNDNNYSAVLQLLKDMDFLKEDGTPTDRYAEYQNQKLAKRALAGGVRKAYPSLFAAYPNADSLQKGDLEGYFRQHTGASESVLEKIVATFTALCSLGDFTQKAEMEEGSPTKTAIHPNGVSAAISPSLQLNLQIHIDANASAETVEIIFRNMRKYILGLDDLE